MNDMFMHNAESVNSLLDGEEEARKLSTIEGIERRCGAAHMNVLTERPSQGDVARAFADTFESELRFMTPGDLWFYWNGQRWQPDTNRTVPALMQRHVKRIAGRLSLAGRHINIDNNGFITGAVTMVSRHDPLKVDASQLDSNHFLLGTPSGVVDLKTGEFRAADKSALITMASGVDPAEAEDCPRWNQFLAEITGGDGSMVEYIKLWLGYCLTGSISEEQFLFVHATGGTGKGTLLQTVERIAGDYATAIHMDLLLAKPGQAGHSNPIASLRGKRIVIASETEKDSFWNASRLKEMTGGDTLRANFMHKDSFTFRPIFKLVGQGEYTPRLKNVGRGEKRRIRVLPLDRRDRVADKHLKATLAAEAPGILRSLINSAVAWRNLSFRDGGGLDMPAKVKSATMSYFAEQGVARLFLDACCELGDDFEATGADMNAAWIAWSKENAVKGQLPITDMAGLGVDRVMRNGKPIYKRVQMK